MRELRLREWRERRALSQAELAERAGLAKLTVTRLERPGPANPHPRTLRQLADALAIEPPELWRAQQGSGDVGGNTPGRQWHKPG